MKRTFGWQDLGDVVVDAQGRYVLACSEGHFSVACLDAELGLVWSNLELDLDADDARLCATPDGGVLVWQKRRHGAVRLDAAGKIRGKLGGREPPDAKVPFLDLCDAEELIADADGSYLAVASNRLQRFDAEGRGIHTWPQTWLRSLVHNRLEPLYIYQDEKERRRNEYEYPGSYWHSRPLAVYASDVRGVFAAGALHLLIDFGRDQNKVGKFDRDGDCLWSVEIEDIDRVRPAVDGAGNVHVLSDRRERRQLHRLTPDGRREQIVAADWRDDGPVRTPEAITALPDGTIGLWDDYGEVTLLDPSGAVRTMSPRAKKALDDARAERDKKLARDEEVD